MNFNLRRFRRKLKHFMTIFRKKKKTFFGHNLWRIYEENDTHFLRKTKKVWDSS